MGVNILEYVRSLDSLSKYQQEKIVDGLAEYSQKKRNSGYNEGIEQEKQYGESRLAEELTEDLMDLVEKVREIKNR